MKRRLRLLVLTVALGLASAAAHGDRSTFHWGGFHAPSASGAAASHGGPGGGQGYRGGHHGGHHGFYYGGAFILGFGMPWWGYPYADVDAVPEDGAAPALYVEQATPQDIANQPGATYFCPDFGYYPAVKSCPAGWMHVESAQPAAN